MKRGFFIVSGGLALGAIPLATVSQGQVLIPLKTPAPLALPTTAGSAPIRMLRTALIETADFGVATDVAFEYDFPELDRVFIGNIGAADPQHIDGLGDVPARGYLRYTTTGSYIAFREPGPANGPLGKLLYLLDIRAARTVFERAEQGNYSALEPLQRNVLLGLTEYGLGKDREAIGYFEHALKSPDGLWDVGTRLLLASAFENIGQILPARKLYSWIVEHAHHYEAGAVAASRVAIARIARAVGKFDLALHEYRAVLKSTRLEQTRARRSFHTSARAHQHGTFGVAGTNPQARHGADFGLLATRAQNTFCHTRNLTFSTSGSLRLFTVAGAAPYRATWVAESAWNTNSSLDLSKLLSASIPSRFSMTDVGAFLELAYFVDMQFHPGAVYTYTSTRTVISVDSVRGGMAVATSLQCIVPKATTDPIEFSYAFTRSLRTPGKAGFDPIPDTNGLPPDLKHAVDDFETFIGKAFVL